MIHFPLDAVGVLYFGHQRKRCKGGNEISKWLIALSGVLAVGTAVGFATARQDIQDTDKKEQNDAPVVACDKLPAAARDALTKLAGDAKIGEVTLEDGDAGRR